MIKQARLLLCLIVVWLACSAHAQPDISTRQFTLAAIHFEGLKNIEAAKAVALSGLQKGQAVKLQHLNEAAQRLLESGIFGQVKYRYKYRGDDLEATFVVEESRTSLPCYFDNFAWFSDDELHAAIRRDLPNFDGKATEGGEMVETIRKALERLLGENKLPGRVEAEMTNFGSAHLFKVDGARLPICAVNFAGVTAFEEAFLRGTLEELFTVDFSRAINALIARDKLIPLYRQKGYLKVRLQRLQGIFHKAADDKCRDKVTVLLPIEEGLSYQWNEPVWSGNQVLTPELLNRRLTLKPGEVADGLKIDKGIRQISEEYTERGYFGLQLQPQPQFDDAARTVTFRFTLHEGPQYNFGNLTLTGANATRGQKLKEQWATLEGKPYTSALLRKAFETAALSGRNVQITTAPEHEKRIVNLTVEIQ
jgi:outer membrane protein assembly factor BamA